MNPSPVKIQIRALEMCSGHGRYSRQHSIRAAVEETERFDWVGKPRLESQRAAKDAQLPLGEVVHLRFENHA